jgi:hypothetical protein
MKIAEILEKMDDFTDDERKKYLGGMWQNVSHLSKNTLLNFQNEWNGSLDFEEFKKKQNKIIKDCIKMEIMINDIKQEQGLVIFTLDTEIT